MTGPVAIHPRCHGKISTDLTRAWVGLGSNLGDPGWQVLRGLERLAALPGCKLGPVSPRYRSAPVGVIAQPQFCNAVAALDTSLDPAGLLEHMQAIEASAGRVRARRWGPRILDLDLLLYGDRVLADPALTLPHPRLHERAFVLIPLAQVAPDLIIARHGRAADLAASLQDQAVTLW